MARCQLRAYVASRLEPRQTQCCQGTNFSRRRQLFCGRQNSFKKTSPYGRFKNIFAKKFGENIGAFAVVCHCLSLKGEIKASAKKIYFFKN
jgi:hypothetical protein